MSDNDWRLDHPVKALSIVGVMAGLGDALGALARWVLVIEHMIPAEGITAGTLLGTGGTLCGALAGMAVVSRLSKRHARKRVLADYAPPSRWEDWP